MTQHSRRTFLITSGVAATTAGAVASGALPAAAAVADSSDAAPDHGRSADHGAEARSVVAYVSDAASGQVTVMSGDREVVVTDHALVRRLTREVG